LILANDRHNGCAVLGPDRDLVGLLVGQSKGRSGAVRVGSFIDDDLEVAAPPDDDPDTVPVSNIELET
jgi:hypothetical protein